MAILLRGRSASSLRPTGPSPFPVGLQAQGLIFSTEPFAGSIRDIRGSLTGAALNGNAFVAPASIGGSSLVVDGSGDYAKWLNQPAVTFSGTTTWTISIWFYWASKGSYNALFDLADGAGSGNRLATIFLDGAGDYFVNVNTSGGGNGGSLGFQNFLPNVWNHTALVRNGVNLTAYINGQTKLTTSGLGAAAGPSDGDLYLGKNQTGGGSDWNGQYGPVSVWNYAKSDAEIWNLYDPRTRWDLQWQPSNRAYSFMSAAAAAAGYLLVKN